MRQGCLPGARALFLSSTVSGITKPMVPAQPSYAGDMLTLRRADAHDSQALWSWRNDEATRAASLNDAPIPWDRHEQWFLATLSDPARAILIALDDGGDRVGMVRFDVDSPATAIVSINVAPERRGDGVGRSLLHSALEWMTEQGHATTVIAVVRSDNSASLRIFEREGFVFASQAGEFVTLTNTIERRLS